MVPAVRQRPLVAGWNEQVAAALAAVRPRQAEVDDPPPPHIVDHSECLRRRLDDHRARREIDDAEEVDRVGVRGQEHRLRPHQLREDQDRVVLHADVVEAPPDRVRRRSTEAVEVCVHVRARSPSGRRAFRPSLLRGAPWANSRLPMRVSKKSGVPMDCSVSFETPSDMFPPWVKRAALWRPAPGRGSSVRDQRRSSPRMHESASLFARRNRHGPDPRRSNRSFTDRSFTRSV